MHANEGPGDFSRPEGPPPGWVDHGRIGHTKTATTPLPGRPAAAFGETAGTRRMPLAPDEDIERALNNLDHTATTMGDLMLARQYLLDKRDRISEAVSQIDKRMTGELELVARSLGLGAAQAVR